MSVKITYRDGFVQNSWKKLWCPQGSCLPLNGNEFRQIQLLSCTGNIYM